MIITRDEMAKLKPEPDGIIKALELLNVTREESIFVGDSVIDIQAAHKAGVTSVALSQGMSSAHVLAREEPDYLISKIEEVEDIIHS
jgi:phosphoglycolate phosphatase-like HAD superfamily hydrolase